VTAPWPAASPAPALAPGEVHVWKVDLGAEISASVDEGILSADERARAARFLRAPDRARSIAARVALRTLLAEYTGEAPAALGFVTGPHGKPALAPGSATGGPRFNVAHSGRLVLLAFAACDVGVDVEEIRSGVDVESLAARFFSADEAAALSAAPRAERDRTFFRIWTRREALLKAAGTGLAAAGAVFSTTTHSGTALASVRDVEGFRSVFLADLEPAAGYAAAVATAEPTRLQRLGWGRGRP
jgi:4'-phosphopantetheinyl transferase